MFSNSYHSLLIFLYTSSILHNLCVKSVGEDLMKKSHCNNSADVKRLESVHADTVPQVTSIREDFISRHMLLTPYMELISKETFIILFFPL